MDDRWGTTSVLDQGAKELASVFLVHIFKNVASPQSQLRVINASRSLSPQKQIDFVYSNIYWLLSAKGKVMMCMTCDCLGFDDDYLIQHLVDRGMRTIERLSQLV